MSKDGLHIEMGPISYWYRSFRSKAWLPWWLISNNQSTCVLDDDDGDGDGDDDGFSISQEAGMIRIGKW